MRQFPLIVIAMAMSLVAMAQDSPVRWSFASNKISADKYELHLQARVEAPWHIFSQLTPHGGPQPTVITLTKNSVIKAKAGAKELGKKIYRHAPEFGVDVQYFDGDVDFIYVVKLKQNVKTIAKSTVEFMVWNEAQCLPASKVHFAIELN